MSIIDPDLTQIAQIVKHDTETLVRAARTLDAIHDRLTDLNAAGGNLRVAAASVASLAAVVWQHSMALAAVIDDLQVSLGTEMWAIFGPLSLPLARFATAVRVLEAARAACEAPILGQGAAWYRHAIDAYETALVGLRVAMRIDAITDAPDRDSAFAGHLRHEAKHQR